METASLIEKLNFCPEAEEILLRTVKECAAFDETALSLCREDCSDEGARALDAAVAPDGDGMKALACILRAAALRTSEEYAARGIGRDIFFATMGFLPRFVNACKQSRGKCAFEWTWWFHRQLSLKEFRIGAFEYERTDNGTEKRLSLHIPAGADISRESLRRSVKDARGFFRKFFPEYENAGIYCSTWLLSPALPALLPEGSRIRGFAGEFELLEWDKDSDAALDWIFPRRMPTEELPESTSLQRAAKNFLRGGGKIGWALGRLREDRL